MSQNILLTFSRSFQTLDLARQLSSAGHKIFIADSVEYPISRFSNAVAKSFMVPSPRFDTSGYTKAIIDITHKEHIHQIIPIYEEIAHLSKIRHKLPASCLLFCPDFNLFNELNNKWLFQQKLKALGFDILDIHLIKKPEDLNNLDYAHAYALKPCYSRASQKVQKISSKQMLPKLSIDSHNPWVAQQWMYGERFCTYSVCHQGRVHAHATYPVRYAIDGNSCLSFETINHLGINSWVASLVKHLNFNGQIAFDLIESSDKKLYAIECNPRATSGLLLFKKNDRLDLALQGVNTAPIYPQRGSRKQIVTGMLLYGWRKAALPENSRLKFLKYLFSTKDVVFSSRDIYPFVLEPLTIAEIVKDSRKYKISIPDAFLYDHEWDGE